MASFLQHIGELDSSNALPGNFVMLVDVYPGDGLFQANILWTGQDDDEVQSGQDYVAKLLDEDFLMQLPSDAVTHAMITWTDFYGPNAPQPAWGRRVWAAGCWCGFLLPEQNTDEVWQEIMSVISAGLQQSAPYLMPDIELWGGAMHDKAGNETAFPYRSAIYDVGVLLTIPDDAHEASKLFEHHSNLVDSWWPGILRDRTLTTP
ncbi:hypothetical protein MPSEU_000677300 [Mayamaea pseudoterrestris]|nr:hypothetical protein MPSEU_000677300 [Mayamaea pseudoterrestris]